MTLRVLLQARAGSFDMILSTLIFQTVKYKYIAIHTLKTHMYIRTYTIICKLHFRDTLLLKQPIPRALRSIVRSLKWKYVIIFYESATGKKSFEFSLVLMYRKLASYIRPRNHPVLRNECKFSYPKKQRLVNGFGPKRLAILRLLVRRVNHSPRRHLRIHFIHTN